MRGLTLSETTFRTVLWIKEHSHEYQDPLFSTATLYLSCDHFHSLHLLEILMLGMISIFVYIFRRTLSVRIGMLRRSLQ